MRPRKPDTEPTEGGEQVGSASLSAPGAGAGESPSASASGSRGFAESRAAAAHAQASDAVNTSVRQSGVTSFATNHDGDPAAGASGERRAVGRPAAAEQSSQRDLRRAAESGANSSANNAAHAKLVIHRGRSVGKEFPLSDDEAHIGRWDADGGILPDVDLDSDDPEAKVSRRHARITRRGGQYFIEDLGSTNGTFINRGRRLLPGDRQPLRDGDEVIVGKTFLKFHVLGQS